MPQTWNTTEVPKIPVVPEMRAEIVGAFNSSEGLERAIDALLRAGWDRAEMSLLGEQTLFAPTSLGDGVHGGIADDPNAEREAVTTDPDVRQGPTLAASMAGVIAAFVASGATILTGGTVLAAIVGAAAAGGGATVAMEALGKLWGDSRDSFLQEQIRHGGILLWVALRESDQRGQAEEIMRRHGAIDVHYHEME